MVGDNFNPSPNSFVVIFLICNLSWSEKLFGYLVEQINYFFSMLGSKGKFEGVGIFLDESIFKSNEWFKPI